VSIWDATRGFHGNWCGAGGDLAGDGCAVDDCDRACREHDLCYELLGRWSPRCDRRFVDQLGRASGCSAAKRLTMQAAFNPTNPADPRFLPYMLAADLTPEEYAQLVEAHQPYFKKCRAARAAAGDAAEDERVEPPGRIAPDTAAPLRCPPVAPTLDPYTEALALARALEHIERPHRRCVPCFP